MKKMALLLALVAMSIMTSLVVPEVAVAQMRFSQDFSQSTLQIGVGSVIHNREGIGVAANLKWKHLLVEYSHSFSTVGTDTGRFATPGISVGVIGLPFLKDRGSAFNPFVTLNGSFRTRIYGVADERVIGRESIKLVFAGGPGLGFSVGPVVTSLQIDFGCQYFPVPNPSVEWRVGVSIRLVCFFDQIGSLGEGD